MTLNRIAAGSAVCCAVLFVSACGGGTSATGNPAGSPTTTASGNGAGGGPAGGGRAFPGATGLLAQIDGTTLQVQSADTQTAVTYSASTTFTNTVAAKSSDVVVGMCVQARSARTASGSGGATPTPSPRDGATPIMAASVEISPAINGRCTAGGGRLSGARPPGAAGDPNGPAGRPSSGRTRAPGAGGNGFGSNRFGGLGAFGKVTSAAGTGFTLESSRPANGTATTGAPSMQTVETSTATTYTRSRTANAKALAVGLCVSALGKADDTGSIAATSITLRPAVNGSCSSGFGGRGPGGSPTPAGGNAGA